MPVETPTEEAPVQVGRDIDMYVTLLDSAGQELATKVPCLNEIGSGISNDFRAVGVGQIQNNQDGEDVLDSAVPYSTFARASSWNFRQRKPVNLNQLFWPFQAQRHAEMLIAINVEADYPDKEVGLIGGEVDNQASDLKSLIDRTSAVVFSVARSGTESTFSLDLYPIQVQYSEEVAIITLVDHRYFHSRIPLEDAGVSGWDHGDPLSNFTSPFGAAGKAVQDRSVGGTVQVVGGEAQEIDTVVGMDPSCNSVHTPVGIIADNALLGSLRLPAYIPTNQSAATSADLRDGISSTSGRITGRLYSSTELMDEKTYTLDPSSPAGQRVLAKSSLWPGYTSAVKPYVGTSLWDSRISTNLHWCEDGFITGYTEVSELLSGEQGSTADTRIPRPFYKTCLRIPISSESAGGADIDYALDITELDQAEGKIRSVMVALSGLVSTSIQSGQAERYSGGMVYLNIEPQEEGDATNSLPVEPFIDLTYLAHSSESCYIDFGVWSGIRDGEGIYSRRFVETNEQDETTSPGIVTGPTEPALSAQVRLVPYRQDFCNFNVPVGIVLNPGESLDRGENRKVLATLDTASSTAVCTIDQVFPQHVSSSSTDISADPVRSDDRIKLKDSGTFLNATPTSGKQVIAERGFLNATSTRTPSWTVLIAEC